MRDLHFWLFQALIRGDLLVFTPFARHGSNAGWFYLHEHHLFPFKPKAAPLVCRIAKALRV